MTVFIISLPLWLLSWAFPNDIGLFWGSNISPHILMESLKGTLLYVQLLILPFVLSFNLMIGGNSIVSLSTR